jgi:hypothetical protein
MKVVDALTALLAALDDCPVAFGVDMDDAIDAAKEALAEWRACGTVYRAGTNSPATCRLAAGHDGKHDDRRVP